MGAYVSWTGEGEAKKGHERIGMINFFFLGMYSSLIQTIKYENVFL